MKIRQAEAQHKRRVDGMHARIDAIATDTSILSSLVTLFGDYSAALDASFDVGMKTEDLARQVRQEHAQLDKLRNGIRTLFDSLHRELTKYDSNVKQLVDASLEGQAGDEVGQARRLVAAYRQLDTQVVRDLNNSLDTVLGHISRFRKAIGSFEAEVSRFNSRLQKALGEVHRFERVEQLRLDIVADFSSLGFYRKLKRMDDVVRHHQRDQRLSTDMPPVETAAALRDFMGVIGNDGTLEVDLALHITLHGSVVDNGTLKHFKRPAELENISSTGLTTLILITLLVGLVHMVRRGEPVHVPWVTDEVGSFDRNNFAALLRLLTDNRIDVITAAPTLDMDQLNQFANRYLFMDRGVIRNYVAPTSARAPLATPAADDREVAST